MHTMHVITVTFYVSYVFFLNRKKRDVLRFFALLASHVFSNYGARSADVPIYNGLYICT